jgi:hypothetical protein
MRLQSRARERIKKESLLSNGSLLWWRAALLDWLFPLVRHGFGGFFLWRSRERRREVMEVYASGFAEHQGGYFISCEKHIGSDDWLAYINGNTKLQGFIPGCEGFFIEQCSWFPNKDFLRIPRQGTRVCAYSAKVKVPECVQSSESSHAQIKGNHHKTYTEDKFHIYCRNSNIPGTN